MAHQTAFNFDLWLPEQDELGDPAFSLVEHESERRSLAGCRVERLLKHLGWKMVEVSFETGRRFGQDSPYFVPCTFLYKQKIGITPHICQVVALSEITGYPFASWMKICGFDVSLILQLQLRVANERTIMLVPGFHVGTKTSDRADNPDLTRYCYAKIGSGDAVLYPEVRPGTIVRVDRDFSSEELKADDSAKNIWLVEHPNGITCCRLKSVSDQEVVLLPGCHPLSRWPLRIPTEARILGRVDSQWHPLDSGDFRVLTSVSKPDVLPSPANNLTFSRFLQDSRRRTGLTFREAHRNTLRIAEIMDDRDFRISTGLLSDYEAMNKLPRHIAKIISLCATYGIEFWALMHAAGVRLQTAIEPGPVRSETHVQKEPGNTRKYSVNTLGTNLKSGQRVA